jgi:DNA polymerase III epsilon subunit-like protein
MVGLGYNGEESCLARVSIVNYHGYIVLDTFVRPKEKVTDWRTWVSGVRPQDMQHAPSFETVQTEVAKLLEGKIVIGHAVENDTKVKHLMRQNRADLALYLIRPLVCCRRFCYPILHRYCETRKGTRLCDKLQKPKCQD